MFREKCPRCGKKVSKKYDFCPFCSLDLRNKEKDSKDYGFLGKNDFEDMGIKLPFGLNMMIKPLMRELNKQIMELDKELAKEQKQGQGKNTGQKPIGTKFKIHFGIPGQQPIEINNFGKGLNDGGIAKGQKKVSKDKLVLPKIDIKNLKNVDKLLKKEPKAIVRRLSDSIIYEISLPGVSSIKSIGIAKVATGFEIKAYSKEELFIKHIDIDLELINFYFVDENLVLEFEQSK